MLFRPLTKEEHIAILATKAIHFEEMKEMLMIFSSIIVILITALSYEDIITFLYRNNILHVNDYVNMTSEEHRRKTEYDYFYEEIIKDDLSERKEDNPQYHIYWSKKDSCFYYINRETERKESYKIDHYPGEDIVYAEGVIEAEVVAPVVLPSAPVSVD